MFRNIRQGIDPVFLLAAPAQPQQLRMVRFEMVMTLLVMITCLMVQAIDQPSVQAAQPTSVRPVAEPVVDTSTAISVGVAAPAPTPTTTPAVDQPIIPSCQAAPVPSQQVVNLGQYGEGLAIVRDSTSYYQVYGNDRAALVRQIAQCGPHNEYAATSGYGLNWSYALRANEAGLCEIVGVKVGVRTSMILPYRAPSGSESASLLASWQAFTTALQVHETLHTNLSEQYASWLLTSLQTYPAGDCYTMGAAVEATAQNIARELVQAQRSYDAATNHGATQWAIF